MTQLTDRFYVFHPGATLGRKLFSERHDLIDLIAVNPALGLDRLHELYSFGRQSDFWDDHIFGLILAPAILKISSLDLKNAINLFSVIDHKLFRFYIRRDEDPVRFRRAFWNLNAYALDLSARFSAEKGLLCSKLIPLSDCPPALLNHKKKRIAFVFKGPFKLAHAEFLQEFLIGTKSFNSLVEVHLILIDEQFESIRGRGFDHVRVHSLGRLRDTYAKMCSYYDLTQEMLFDHICWVACVQNLSLYMGMRLAPSQSYWSMKYHSIIMDSIDKYAGLGFGGDSFTYDDIQWFRGRAFPDLTLPNVDQSFIDTTRRLHGIPSDAIVAGVFVRSEKLNNSSYWKLIQQLLVVFPNLHFVIASQSLPPVSHTFLATTEFNSRFHHLGWVDTKKWCQCLDIYIDSFPRGSCLTALEAIMAGVPSIIFDTHHNRESSALPYLLSANRGVSPAGVFQAADIDAIFTDVSKIIASKQLRDSISAYQRNLLSRLLGTRSLYAKDYLNYFLGTTMSIRP